MDFKITVYSILLSLAVISVLARDWTYQDNALDGPLHWGENHQQCNGARQSPVNLIWLNATPVLTGPRVTIHNIAARPTSIKYENSGHGVTITFNFPDGRHPTIAGGPLHNDSFIFHSMHLHWQSEHTIDNKTSDAELHMVHFNSRYGSFAEALDHIDGVAVLGLLYTIPPHAKNPVFDVVRPFVNGISKVLKHGAFHVERKNLFSFLDIIGISSFTVWSYSGSLTTPNCNEVVTWMVHKFPLWVNPAELRLLRSVEDEEGQAIAKNNRPVQPLNGRTIFCY